MTNGLRVLLVEDSEDVLFIMSAELESMGYRVDVATDGWHALKAAKAQRPDLIISDVQMPGISGLELIVEIRRIPELSSIPAIAMTGFSMDSDVKALLANGFTAHVVKPVEPDQLEQLIHQLTQPKKLTKAS